jgi:hypothetical protein
MVDGIIRGKREREREREYERDCILKWEAREQFKVALFL